MPNFLVIAIALIAAATLAFSRRLANSSSWKATITPLASIMGSGFLISAPILAGTVGNLALICMAPLLVLAYAVGGVIRFNIRHFEPIEYKAGPAQSLAFCSRIALVGAYFISVTYYLELLAAFVLKSAGYHSEMAASGVATFLLLVICGMGMWRGMEELESVEKYAVALNLGMIAALLASLAVHNVRLAMSGAWTLPAVPTGVDFHDLRVLLGLLIIVQGFETSRYLGDEHPAEQRIATMRAAQLISSVIYLLFIGLATVLFHAGLTADVTEIIEMIQPVAAVLPILITIAAMGSQFSAAVADVEGAGGLIEDITHRKVPIRYAYLLILTITIALSWSSNVNEIIAYASRAFALYYALQCAVAVMVTWHNPKTPHRTPRLIAFALTGLLCALVFALGIPSG